MAAAQFFKYHDKPKWYSKHQLASKIKCEIAKLNRLDNWHGILQLLEDWGWIAFAISSSLWTWEYAPLGFSLLVYCLAVFVIGARQRGLRVINHQATHKALAKNKVLNFCLATLFGTWLVLESYTGYDDTHNSKYNGHHANLGTENDVDHRSVVKQGLYDENISSEDVKKYLLSIPFQTPQYILFLLQNRIWNPQESKIERVVRLVFFGMVSGISIYLGWSLFFLLYWLVPLFTTANWIGSFIQLAEHYPLISTAIPIDINLSRNRILSPFLNVFLGTHNEGYHLVHHLFPRLPFWSLKKAHSILMQDTAYADLHRKVGLVNLIKELAG